jgi:Cu-processing system permease protein
MGEVFDPRPVLIVAAQEVRDAGRHRWFFVVSALFAVLALALSWLGMAALGAVGVARFGRTAASLTNLVMLAVPLMGLLLGASAIATERERGTLLPLMAQPLTPGELLLGKFLGQGLALAAAVCLGFGLSALVLGWRAGPDELGVFFHLLVWTLGLGLASLSVGIAGSVVARHQATALAAALAIWVVLVFVSDLGLMASALVFDLSPAALFWLAVVNPVQAFKLLALLGAHGRVDLLGTPALYVADALGPRATPLLALVLGLWIFAPAACAFVVFSRRPL